MQTKVALDRIAVYLDEEEVTDQVSTLKKANAGPSSHDSDDSLLGIENGSFKWNAVNAEKEKEKADAKANKNKKGKVSTPPSEATTAIASDPGLDADAEPADHQFELRDISVVFPEGKLSCITGPTASGKTALLVRCACNSF